MALALAAGAAIGGAAAKLVDLAEDHQTTSGGFFLVSSLALALLTLGAVHALGGSGILGAFAAGLAFSLLLEERYAEQLEETQNGLQQLLIVPVFVLFGSMLPWDAWHALGWSGLAFALWALVVRRPPAAALALAVAPIDTPRRGVAFLSWYGPIGVAAIYYALFAERYGLEEYERIFAAGTLAIAMSVVVFSLSATPGSAATRAGARGRRCAIRSWRTSRRRRERASGERVDGAPHGRRAHHEVAEPHDRRDHAAGRPVEHRRHRRGGA